MSRLPVSITPYFVSYIFLDFILTHALLFLFLFLALITQMEALQEANQTAVTYVNAGCKGLGSPLPFNSSWTRAAFCANAWVSGTEVDRLDQLPAHSET